MEKGATGFGSGARVSATGTMDSTTATPISVYGKASIGSRKARLRVPHSEASRVMVM